MPSSYTSSLRLTLPVQGELTGSWGNTVNTGITQLVDTAVAGTTSITMTAANYTLTNNTGATDEARAMFLVLGGTPGNSFNVIVPAVSKLYFVTNGTGFSQTVKTPSGSGISVPNGARMTLRCDGTDVLVAQNYFASLSLGAALPTASGGTGLTSFTANGVAYASSTSALATGSALVFDGTNLGLGVTPSAWNSAYRALQIGATGALWQSASGFTFISDNAFVNSGASNTYITTAAASFYRQNAGVHSWWNAPSGTAGAAISFTQAMTLDASGNLDLGTTGGVDRYQNIIATSAKLTFNAGTGFTGSAATSIYNQSAIAMVFGTNNTERARITSDGDLLVGTTSSVAKLTVNGASSSVGFRSSVGSGEINCQLIQSASSGTAIEFYTSSSTSAGSVTTSGTSTAYNTTSDRRLKENIAPAPSASADIDAIQIVSHDWKAAPDEHVTYGVIAQDLALVAPQAVLQGDNGDEIEKTWGVDYSKLVPMLIKEIQTLRARVAALEQA